MRFSRYSHNVKCKKANYSRLHAFLHSFKRNKINVLKNTQICDEVLFQKNQQASEWFHREEGNPVTAAWLYRQCSCPATSRRAALLCADRAEAVSCVCLLSFQKVASMTEGLNLTFIQPHLIGFQGNGRTSLQTGIPLRISVLIE